MSYLVRQRRGLRRHVGFPRANLDLISLGRARSAVQLALLDKPYRNAARLREAKQTRQHVLAMLANRLGWKLRQWRAVSLGNVEEVNHLEPYAARLFVGSICRLFLVLEEHRRKDRNPLLAFAHEPATLKPGI